MSRKSKGTRQEKWCLWKRGFISIVSPTVHTNPSRKQSFSKTLFKPEESEIAGFSFSCGRKNIFTWKRNFFEHDGVTKVMWFPWAGFTQTQIQNDWWSIVGCLNSFNVMWMQNFQIDALKVEQYYFL